MNESNTLLRVDRLKVRNFRCFSECSLELHPTLTVLVADNALGKTALLDGLRLALNVFVTAMIRSKQCRGLEQSDIHLIRDKEGQMQPQLPTLFSAEGCIDGEMIKWARALKSNGLRARSSTNGTKAIRAVVQRILGRMDDRGDTRISPLPILPLVAFYGTGRLWDERRLTEGKRWHASASPVRVSAYLDCLSPSSSYKSFVAWYEQTAEAVRDPRFKVAGRDERPESAIAAVREAVRSVLGPTGWTTIDWQFAPKNSVGQPQGRGFVVVEHSENGRLPLSHLSDGVRNMVALVADLTHRCVQLNPHLGEAAARLTPGIVMIDEVDMHLHPRWQQLVVGLLQATFPKMQLVLSTHSPHVLSTVDFSSVRVIHLANGLGEVTKPDFQTLGDESADVLARVMEVDPIPKVESARLLSHYRSLVQNNQDNSGSAREIWSQLLGHFGADHHLLQEAAVLRRLQEFKRENGLG